MHLDHLEVGAAELGFVDVASILQQRSHRRQLVLLQRAEYGVLVVVVVEVGFELELVADADDACALLRLSRPQQPNRRRQGGCDVRGDDSAAVAAVAAVAVAVDADDAHVRQEPIPLR